MLRAMTWLELDVSVERGADRGARRQHDDASHRRLASGLDLVQTVHTYYDSYMC